MIRIFTLRAIAVGTGIAAIATALSFALAEFVIGNVYYASVFIPFAMLACVAVAWFSFLRDDGLARRHSDGGAAVVEPRPAEPALVSGLGSSGPDGIAGSRLVTPSGLDASMYAPRDGSLVKRRAENVSATPRQGWTGRAALVWAAAELAALAAALYSIAGIGARFYR